MFNLVLSLGSYINISGQYKNRNYFTHVWLLDLRTGYGDGRFILCWLIWNRLCHKEGGRGKNSMNCKLNITYFVCIMKKGTIFRKKILGLLSNNFERSIQYFKKIGIKWYMTFSVTTRCWTFIHLITIYWASTISHVLG